MLEGQEECNSRVMCKDCTDEMKETRGCKGGVEWLVGDWKVDGCPEKYITEETMRLIKMWSNWKTFGLPFAGTYLDQPAYVVDVINALEHEKAAYNEGKRNGQR